MTKSPDPSKSPSLELYLSQLDVLFKSYHPWITLANQEVILRIGPLGKLSHFESTAEIFLVYIASISLASGPILSITSWYAKVLRVPSEQSYQIVQLKK